MLHRLEKGHEVLFDYRRKTGRIEQRSGTFVCIEFGQADGVLGERWFLRLLCDKRRTERSFALDRIEMIYNMGSDIFWERTSTGYRRPA